MKGWHYASLVIVATSFAGMGHAQVVLTPPSVRIDTFPRPVAASLPIAKPPTGQRICVDCHPFTIPPGSEPAFIIKDSAERVLAMVPPGDSSTRTQSPFPIVIESEMVAAVEVRHDSTLAPILGRGFENGMIIITLNPAGSEAWRRAIRPTRTPP